MYEDLSTNAPGGEKRANRSEYIANVEMAGGKVPVLVQQLLDANKSSFGVGVGKLNINAVRTILTKEFEAHTSVGDSEEDIARELNLILQRFLQK